MHTLISGKQYVCTLLISDEQPQHYRSTRASLEDDRKEKYLFQLIYINYLQGYVLAEKG